MIVARKGGSGIGRAGIYAGASSLNVHGWEIAGIILASLAALVFLFVFFLWISHKKAQYLDRVRAMRRQ
jgi:hypothetical protein